MEALLPHLIQPLHWSIQKQISLILMFKRQISLTILILVLNDFLFKIELIHQYRAVQFKLSLLLFLFYQSSQFMEDYLKYYRLVLPRQYLSTKL